MDVVGEEDILIHPHPLFLVSLCCTLYGWFRDTCMNSSG